MKLRQIRWPSVDKRYIAERDRNRVAKRTVLDEWDEIYASSDKDFRERLDALVAEVIAEHHRRGGTNYGPDAAKETIIAGLHGEDDLIFEQKRQRALRSNRNALRFT